MGRKTRMATAGAGAGAVLAGPSGARRLLGSCLMVLLLGGLLLGVGAGALAWLATNNPGGESSPLPCAPNPVAIAYSGADIPADVRKAVKDALTRTGRISAIGGYGSDEGRDLAVSWWPTSLNPEPPQASDSSDPVVLRLMTAPTAAEVTAALGDHLRPCAEPSPTHSPTTHGEDNEDADFLWPWEHGWTGSSALLLAVAAWWTVGPPVVRQAGRLARDGVWPLRLVWRRGQRRAYLRQLNKGWLTPALWPNWVEPGQRWVENAEAMHDRRTPRQQAKSTEPERRAALRAAIRTERLTGDGILPARLWRSIYRTPTEGAPKTEGV